MKALFSALALSFFISVAFAGDFEGTWKTTIATPDGDREITYVFKMEGDSMTGMINGIRRDRPIENIVVKGKQLTFENKVSGRGEGPGPNNDREFRQGNRQGREGDRPAGGPGMQDFPERSVKHECTLKDDNTIVMKITGSPMGEREIILKRQK